MDKFTLNGTTYSQNDAGTHFYKKEEGGKKQRIKYEEFERAFDAYWAAQGVTDPVDEEQEKEVKKTKKRRSKDIAFELDGVTLTTKQVDFIRHLPDTSFWEDGIDSALWVDVLTEEIGGQFAGKPMTVGAMISTLREKKLVEVGIEASRKGKPKFMTFTDLGKEFAKKLGLS